MQNLNISVVIPTYRREQVLLDTLGYLLPQAQETADFLELLVIDQTEKHKIETEKQLKQWMQDDLITWIRQDTPHLTKAMNLGLLHAKGKLVLFLDDDIIPSPDLVEAHLRIHRERPTITAVVGQILQPGEQPENLEYTPGKGHLTRYMDFPFRSTTPGVIENAMAGNFSMKREFALELGGFDENFLPPVASRFESEFAKRSILKGGTIWFGPAASIQHLHVKEGGTRAYGGHLNSMSPRYSVGDYYFALKQGTGWERLRYIIKKPFREVRTRYHLAHPWWIPLKLIGEIRAFIQALQLYRKGATVLNCKNDLTGWRVEERR